MDFSFLCEQSFLWGLQRSSNFLSCEPHICSYLGKLRNPSFLSGGEPALTGEHKGYEMTSTGYRMTASIIKGASAALPTSQMGLGSLRTVVTATQTLIINPKFKQSLNTGGIFCIPKCKEIKRAIEYAKLLTHYLKYLSKDFCYDMSKPSKGLLWSAIAEELTEEILCFQKKQQLKWYNVQGKYFYYIVK